MPTPIIPCQAITIFQKAVTIASPITIIQQAVTVASPVTIHGEIVTSIIKSSWDKFEPFILPLLGILVSAYVAYKSAHFGAKSAYANNHKIKILELVISESRMRYACARRGIKQMVDMATMLEGPPSRIDYKKLVNANNKFARYLGENFTTNLHPFVSA
jgi:hypothetical protein